MKAGLFSPFEALSGPLWLCLMITGVAISLIVWAVDVAVRSLSRPPLPRRARRAAPLPGALGEGAAADEEGGGGAWRAGKDVDDDEEPAGERHTKNRLLRWLGVRDGEEGDTVEELGGWDPSRRRRAPRPPARRAPAARPFRKGSALGLRPAPGARAQTPARAQNPRARPKPPRARNGAVPRHHEDG